MTRSPGARTYAAFAGAILIGGANFVAVTFSNLELPPLFGATVRFGAASVLLLVLASVLRVPLVRGRLAAAAALYGLLSVGAAYSMLYYALLELPAGTAAVIVATAPLFTLVIAVLTGQERFTGRGVIGGVLAVGGIAVLSSGSFAAQGGAPYLVAALLGAMAIAASSVVAKAHPQIHPLAMNAIGMVCGSAVLALGSLALGEAWSLPVQRATWGAVAWLALFGSVGLFQLMLYVIRRWSASASVYAVTAMPVVAAALGVLLLGQPVTPRMLLGGALVLVAVYVGAVPRAPAAARTSTRAEVAVPEP